MNVSDNLINWQRREQEMSVRHMKTAAAQIHLNDDRINSLISNASSLSNAHQLTWCMTYKMRHHRLLWHLVPCLHRRGCSSWRSWYAATNCTIRAIFMWRSGLCCDWSFGACSSTFLWQLVSILILQQQETDQLQNVRYHEWKSSLLLCCHLIIYVLQSIHYSDQIIVEEEEEDST